MRIAAVELAMPGRVLCVFVFQDAEYQDGSHDPKQIVDDAIESNHSMIKSADSGPVDNSVSTPGVHMIQGV